MPNLYNPFTAGKEYSEEKEYDCYQDALFLLELYKLTK